MIQYGFKIDDVISSIVCKNVFPGGPLYLLKVNKKPNSGSFSSQWKGKEMIMAFICNCNALRFETNFFFPWRNIIFPGMESREIPVAAYKKNSIQWSVHSPQKYLYNKCNNEISRA